MATETYPIAEKIGKLLEGKEYTIIPDALWMEFEEEHPSSLRAIYKTGGYPMVSYRGKTTITKRHMHQTLKRGIPCLVLRNKPVFQEKHRHQVERKYAVSHHQNA